MTQMICIQCGRENCNGHKCAQCGHNAEAPLIVDSLFFCDKFCLYEKDHSHPLLSNIPAVEFAKFETRASIIARMRALKEEAQAAGVAWIK